MNGYSYIQLHLSQQTSMVRLAKVKYGFSLAQNVAILIDGHLKQKAMSLLGNSKSVALLYSIYMIPSELDEIRFV